MKKIITYLLLSAMLLTSLSACGNKTPQGDETQPQIETNSPAESTPVETTTPEVTYDPKDYAYFHTFPAPEGDDYRQIVLDYMIKMSKIEWTPNETFRVTWKNEGDFTVNLEFEAGKTYYGVPYGDTKANADEFLLYLDGNTFTPNSTYYEEIVGNNCSSSMVMAFQQIINLHYYGSLKPTGYRGEPEPIKFVGDIQKPDLEIGDAYKSNDVWEHNSKEVIMNAYAQLKKGDILYRTPRGSSGHTRMVYSDANVKYKANKEINYATSYIEVIEATNSWNSEKNSTWWVQKKYTFNDLYEKMFMPSTLTIYETKEPLKDAYLMLSKANTAESIAANGLIGNVSSNFPLTFVRVTIKDASGKTVGQVMENNFTNKNEGYSVALQKFSSQLGLISTFENALPAGTYTYILEAGIARGSVEIENVTFTK